MTITLDKEYRIERDIASWNLVWEKHGAINPTTGKPKISRDMTFHPTLQYALEAYSDKVLGECSSVQEVLEKIAETQELIKTTVAKQLGKMEKGK